MRDPAYELLRIRLLSTSVDSPEKFAGCCELFCPLARSHRGVAAQRCDLWSVESFVALGRGGLRGQRLTLRVGPVPSEKKAEERPLG